MFFVGRDDRIPNIVAHNTTRVRQVNTAAVPSVDDAITMYRGAGGTITTDCSFGLDPLANNDILVRRRDEEFVQNNQPFDVIYNNVVNGNGSLLEGAVLSFLRTTTTLN